MQNEIPDLEKGGCFLVISWGLKVEFAEPVGQVGMAVPQGG